MSKKMLIDATHAEETRVVVVNGNKVEEFDFESQFKRQLAGSIYLAKVTRVEPSLQAAFVDYGGNRHGFLAFSEIHPDYYQIPVADREALMAEEDAYTQRMKAQAEAEDEDEPLADPSLEDEQPAVEVFERDDANDREDLAGESDSDTDSDDDAPKKKPRRRVRRRSSGSKTLAADIKSDVEDAVVVSDLPAEPTGDEPAVTQQSQTDDAADDAVQTDLVESNDGEDIPQSAEANSEGVSPEDVSGVQAQSDAATDELISKDKSVSAKTEAEASQEEQPSQEDVAPNVTEDTPQSEAVPGMEILDADSSAEVNAGGNTRVENVTEGYSDENPQGEAVKVVAAPSPSKSEARPERRPRPRRYKIQEVINIRQILLVQVVKEERGNKGAALTTYLSLPGRYCVLMPNTARGGGISRKITNVNDRKKLKKIANEIDVPARAGLIVRTAGAQRTKVEIKRDYEYLLRLWEKIRELTLQSVAPCKIYEEGDLIKRSIRDLYSKEIDEVIVAGAEGYRSAKDFMKMIMPSHAKKVKHYAEQLPLYARYQVETYLSGMFNPTVQLPSGGYLVIGITEALVAVDVNSGRATKEGSIEQTALKTNLEAAEELARQLRLRDLAGLVVVDFIDMDERRNNVAVEKRFKEKLKTDRARIQVGRISSFGLLEMSRQRLRPGMLEATTQACVHCHGTGLVRSDDNVSLAILRQLEEEGVRAKTKEVLVRAPISVANFLMNQKRAHISDIEARYGLSVRINCDPSLMSPQFELEKFKTATKPLAPTAPVVTGIIEGLDDIEVSEEQEQPETDAQPQAAEGDEKPKKKRRRRRRRSQRDDEGTAETETDVANEAEGVSPKETAPSEGEVQAETETKDGVLDGKSETPSESDAKPKRTRRSRKPKKTEVEASDQETAEVSGSDVVVAAPEEVSTEEPPKRKPRTRRKKAVSEEPSSDVASTSTPTDTGDASTEAPSEVSAEEGEAPVAKPKRRTRRSSKKTADADATSTAQSDIDTSEPSAEASEEPKPKKRRAPAARKKKTEDVAVKDSAAETVPEMPVAEVPAPEQKSVAAVSDEKATQSEATPEAASEAIEAEAPKKPKRRGWWSLGR